VITHTYTTKLLRFALILIVIVCASHQVVEGSYRCTEYGVGILGMKKSSPVGILKRPDPTSDTVAIWLNDTIRVITLDTFLVGYDVMLEYGYEIVGFPVLDFGKDSTWVKVTYNCRDTLGKPQGWVHVDEEITFVKTWSQILVEPPLFFRKKKDICFFSAPDSNSPLKIKLFEKHGNRPGYPDYIMYPQRIVGSWMEVIVETPSNNCGQSEWFRKLYGIEKAQHYRAWIHFLDKRKRPIVFFYTRGC
jgi:hypothetical protein